MSYARKTKIIATMGPACADRQILRERAISESSRVSI